MTENYVGTFPTYFLSADGAPHTWVGSIHFRPDALEIQASTDAVFERAMAVARERADFIGVVFPETVIREGFEPYEALLPRWPGCLS